MPLYDFECEKGHRFEKFVPLANFSDPVFCSCQSPAKRCITAPMFAVDYTGYHCPITGDWIGSKSQHNNNLDKHGCRVFESGEKEAAAEFRRKEDEKFDRMIEDSVEQEIESWDSGKKEQLHNELVNGKSDLEVVRK